jgi:predicted acylesterase/phospholipase RssA
VSSNKIENVLVLQGGGSLGAFACGVFKALANKNIRIDIVAAGTSIGGINAAIIAGSVDKEHPERTLEEFWLELAEYSVNMSHYMANLEGALLEQQRIIYQPQTKLIHYWTQSALYFMAMISSSFLGRELTMH